AGAPARPRPGGGPRGAGVSGAARRRAGASQDEGRPAAPAAAAARSRGPRPDGPAPGAAGAAGARGVVEGLARAGRRGRAAVVTAAGGVETVGGERIPLRLATPLLARVETA